MDICTDEVSGRLLALFVGNSGPTVATNVRIKVDPPLPAMDDYYKQIAETVQKRLARGIASLPPGHTRGVASRAAA